MPLPKYSLTPLSEYSQSTTDLQNTVSANAEARNEALIERARENPGKFTLIESRISNGQASQLVLTVVNGKFWEDEEEFLQEDDDDDDAEEQLGIGKTRVDDVDMMMAGMTLNGLLKSMGEPAAFLL